MLKVGIYGASGYTGQELLRLLIRHPEVEVVALTSRKFKGTPVSDVFPVFEGLSDMKFIDASPDDVADLSDVVFLALPHGVAMEAVPLFLKTGSKVVDLGADFRLRDVKLYEQWYKEHTVPDLIKKAVYGLPELYRDNIKAAKLVANPGCYPTGVILGLAPVLKEEWIDFTSIIVDSKSGVSGAGREPQTGSLFCEVSESLKAYKINQHRHMPEMEQELGLLAGADVKISFVPHLVPMNRGILNTIYAELRERVSTSDLIDLYKEFYSGEEFVRIYKAGTFPAVSSVRGSNYCDIGITVDGGTGRVIIVSAVDNLIKGAAGQAIQNMNLMCGLSENSGLKLVSLFP
ncbi:MAG: N-acetyl-gamma-glutamyl-phosphate reductase [Thermodesulfobacteriota bacterium]|nr:N-acetyl-gamma-glutamyl-phosphate reductase [Thermodesulfobacteriota bacterium]